MKKTKKPKYDETTWVKANALCSGELQVIVSKKDQYNYVVSILSRQLLDESHVVIPFLSLKEYVSQLERLTHIRANIPKEIKKIIGLAEALYYKT